MRLQCSTFCNKIQKVWMSLGTQGSLCTRKQQAIEKQFCATRHHGGNLCTQKRPKHYGHVSQLGVSPRNQGAPNRQARVPTRQVRVSPRQARDPHQASKGPPQGKCMISPSKQGAPPGKSRGPTRQFKGSHQITVQSHQVRRGGD